VKELQQTLNRRSLVTGALVAAGSGATLDRVHAQNASPAAEPDSRVITTVMGEVTVPLNPQRVIVMENRVDLEVAVALQLPVAGVGVWFGAFGTEDDYVNPWIPFTPGPDVAVFNTAEPDVEALILLEPDLNISRIFYLDGTFGFDYDTLSHISPIIPVSHTEDANGFYAWREELIEVAGFLSRESLLDDVLNDYDTLINTVKTSHAETLANSRLVMLRYTGDGQLFINNTSLFASVLNDLGGTILELPLDDEGVLSIEQSILLDDADGMLFWGEQGEWDQVSEYDIWNGLSLVRDGRYVIGSVMTNYGSVYAAMEVARQFDQLLTRIEQGFLA